MGNEIILNINRPTVLRQYYRADITVHADTFVVRVTYGYGSNKNSVESDPNKSITKHSTITCIELHSFLIYIYKII